MVRASPAQTGFNAGEFSPRMTSRVDFSKYGFAGEVLENILPLPQGGLARRPGGRFIKEVKTSSVETRVIPFQVGTEQAYIIEAGESYFRFYKNQARLAANNVTTAITNGTFNTNLTGWSDDSTGSASIAQSLSESTIEGTFSAAQSATFRFGDGAPDGLNFGFKFNNTTAGDVTKVRVKVGVVITSFASVIKIYSDSSGQPNAQVGGNSASVTLNSTGDKEYTWTTGPTLSASTDYWVVLVDTDAAGTGDVRLSIASDQGSAFETGRHDTITSIDDGTVGLPAGDLRCEITVTLATSDGELNLIGASGETAIAGQTLAIGGAIESTFFAAQSTTLQFGDNIANGLNVGLKFNNTLAGTVEAVRIQITAVGTAFNVQASIYTDSTGQPGTLVTNGASDTVNLAETGIITIKWPASSPSVTAATDFWLILTDTSGGGTGDVTLSIAADQGSAFETGSHDTITSINDDGGGDLRAEIFVEIDTADIDTTHILALRVSGNQNDEVKLRLGTAPDGVDIINDRLLAPGWHRIAFTPSLATIYLQFRNEQAKTIQVDDISILDNVPIEIATPWTSAQLDELNWAQSADVLYLVHPDFPPYKLERRSDADWALIEVSWQDGPYLDENITDTTMTISSATAGKGLTLTLSSAEGVNSGQGLLSTDVGRLFRIHNDGDVGEAAWGVITAVASIASATVDLIRDAIQIDAAQITWSLGVWSDTTGYPTSFAFFEQRTVLAGSNEKPQTFWMSQSADLENMQPDSFVGDAVVIEDDDALVYTIAAEKVNAIRWLSPGSILVLGTTGGEWIAKSDGPVITPTDVEVRRETAFGSSSAPPVRIGNAVVFVQEAEREIREFVFSFDVDNHVAPDLTILSNHITESGISRIVWAQQPDSILWCLRRDGLLAAVTLKRDQSVVGWSRHILGGEFASTTGNPVVESIAVIPGNNGSGQFEDSTNRDEVWIVVKRTINSGTKRYIEMFEQIFEGPLQADYTSEADYRAAVLAEQAESYYSDSLLTLDVPLAITNIVIS